MWEFIKNHWLLFALAALLLIMIIVLIIVSVNIKKREKLEEKKQRRSSNTFKSEISSSRKVKPIIKEDIRKQEKPKKQDKKENIKPKKQETSKKQNVEVKEQEVKKVEKKPVKKEEKEEKDENVKYRVVYDKEQKNWIVRIDGGERASKRCATKEEALKVAKDLAKKKDADLSVHKKNGKFQKQ